jgi:hypothetical protein
MVEFSWVGNGMRQDEACRQNGGEAATTREILLAVDGQLGSVGGLSDAMDIDSDFKTCT